jgi:eukaryotic-like serine/threonine-protein kinase
VAAIRCLDDNLATELVSGALSRAQVAKVEAHLATCADCRSLVAALATTSNRDSDIHTQPRPIGQAATLPAQPHRALVVGDRVGRYLILGAIGAGGMGVVFSAYDPQLDRKVAIKLLRSGSPIGATEARARLRREAQAIAQLNHPNVVGVYDVGTTEAGDVYVAMEFVDGDTLTAWLPRWNRSWRDIVDIFVQAGRGLAAAHEVGLLHRDFKPDNVLVGTDGRPRVGDFGLARSLITPEEHAVSAPRQTPVSSALTATGTVLGTPRYMPPEQLGGGAIDARSDQFAFCVALYEALFGCHPLRGETAVAMCEHGVRAEPPMEGHKVSAGVIRAVMRGLEREPAKRFPSMSALLSELTPPTLTRSPRWIAAVLAGVLLIAVTVVLRVTGSNAASSETASPPNPELIKRVELLDERLRDALVDRQRLREQLVAAIETRDSLQEDLGTLQEALSAQLAEKDEEIELLNDEVRALQKKVTGVPRPRKGKLGSRSVDDLHAATSIIQGDLQGCFGEWRERNPTGRIRFVVEVTITSAGRAESASTSNVGDSSLPLCVRGALLRAHFPRGPTQRVAFEVRSAEGSKLAIHVVDARPKAPTELIELD